MKLCREKRNWERLTLLGIEEEEGFVESKSVIVWRRRMGLVLGQGFDNDDGQCNHKERNNKRPDGILQGLVAAHDAPQVHIFLFAVALMRTQQPALLGLIQMTMLMQMLLLLPFHVSAPLIVCA